MNNGNTSARAATKQEALALLQGNRLPEARKLYAELCQSDSTDADARYMLGMISGRLKQYTEAADFFRQAIALQPQMAMAHYGLGAALKAQNRLAEAVDSFRETLRIQPGMAEVRFELASVLHSIGKVDDARENLQQAVHIKPHPWAYHFLGNICSAQGQLNEAATNYQQALKLDSSEAEVHNKLGFTLYSLGRIDEAEVSFRQALKRKSDFVSAHNNLGIVLTVQGRIDEAIACFWETLRIEPGSADAAFGILNAYEWAGDIQQAAEQLAPLIERYPEHIGTAQAFARLCKPLGRCPEAIALIQKMLCQDDLAPIEKRQLHFSIGKLYDAMGSWDAAFAHYQSANTIQAPPYDPALHARNIDAVISTFTAGFLRRLPRATPASGQPVFIVGMPRSGTSLVEQVLSSHPQVSGAGELGDITQLVLSLPAYLDPAAGYPQCLRKLTQDATNSLARGYLERLEKLSGGAARVTDKMPHNFLHLGVINLLFPKARIIHCMRDPLDTCLSIYFQYFNASHAYAYNLGYIGTHYRDYQRLMAHWRQVLDIPMLEVQYEDIVTRPDEMIPKLVEFCGLDWDPACLRFYEHRRFVNTASYDQVRQPLHPRSIGRWKHYEKYLEPLRSALVEA